MKWSKIQNTELAQTAIGHIVRNTFEDQYPDSEVILHYHNLMHIQAMYDYLDKTNEPYDECLDWAVLFHDIVYDNQPEKEYRSAVMFSDMKAKYSGCDLNLLDEGHVAALIIATEKHSVTYPSSSAIIRADLHALTDTVQTFHNYNLILKESMCLYDIDEKTFAENNIRFMCGSPFGGDYRGLYGRVEKNMEKDPDHREFYKDVKRGIVSTINLSRILKGDL